MPQRENSRLKEDKGLERALSVLDKGMGVWEAPRGTGWEPLVRWSLLQAGEGEEAGDTTSKMPLGARVLLPLLTDPRPFSSQIARSHVSIHPSVILTSNFHRKQSPTCL